MNLLTPIWKKSKEDIPSLGWKFVLTLVGNSYTYKLGMDPGLVMGGSTIVVLYKKLKLTGLLF